MSVVFSDVCLIMYLSKHPQIHLEAQIPVGSSFRLWADPRRQHYLTLCPTFCHSIFTLITSSIEGKIVNEEIKP